MHVIDTIARVLDEAGLLVERRGALPSAVSAVTDDSRGAAPGALFVAVHGTERDGHDYLDAAARAGAAAAIVEDPSRSVLPALVVRNARRAGVIAASAANDWPARRLQLVGVTGTNGKTTTVNMLRHLFDEGERRAASIGTLGILIGSEGAPLPGGGGLTTPGPIELQRIFRALRDRGVRRVAMEVSSHALDQGRAEGIEFAAATFTNLTRDHLDYHGTMERYFEAKATLIDHLVPHGTVVSNLDDPAWDGDCRTERRSVGFSERSTTAAVHVEDVRFGPRGSEWTLHVGADAAHVDLPLIGDFNIMNALGAAATGYALGVPSERIAERLSTMPQVPGRLEVLRESPTVLRDYAHTPDALERALDAVRPFAPERLIVVFGCGGDRDRGKRPQMGAIAESRADVAIVTSDNPRTEDPERILDDIEAGMTRGNHERIEDRRAAIARALELATPRDVVVLAGKGHETYQVRGTTKLPFDEKIIVGELLAERSTSHGGRTMSTAPPTVGRTFWTIDRVAGALNTLSPGNLPRGHGAFARVWTDTRTIEPGDLFVALVGEQFDAHDFLADAVAKGAAGVVVSRSTAARALGVPVFEVADTLVALGALGRYRRRAWGQPVVAVVGTNGKTSTKELLRAALGSTLTVHATTGNLNNLIGVPLTLLAIPDDADLAVIEMGTNQPGEIARLRAIVEPTITVVTSIGEEHLEGLGDVAGVLREELAAADGVARRDRAGVAARGGRGGAGAGATRRGRGSRRRRSSTERLERSTRMAAARLTVEGRAVEVPLRGAHNLRNATLALAVASEVGVSMADAARGIAAMPVPRMRVNWEEVGRATLINDAYNSNPGSARAALELLERTGAGRQRVAILATMLELGAHTPDLHDGVARAALSGGVDLIGAIGEYAAAFERVAPGDARVVSAPDADALWSALASRVALDAVILLKGSRGMRLERLVEPITAWANAIQRD